MMKKDNDGLYYVSETGRRYELAAGHCICSNRGSVDDYCYILYSGFTEDEYKKFLNGKIERDDDTWEVFVGFFAGASFINESFLNETDQIVKNYVDKFEEEHFKKEEKKMRTVKSPEFIRMWNEMEQYWINNDGDNDESSYYNRIINQDIIIELPLLGIRTELFWCPPTVEGIDEIIRRMIEDEYFDLLVQKETCYYTGSGIWIAEVPFLYDDKPMVMVVDNEDTNIWTVYQNALKDNGKWESVEYDELMVTSFDADHILPDFQKYYMRALQLLAERKG